MEDYNSYFTRNIYFNKQAVKDLKVISDITGMEKLSEMIYKSLSYYAEVVSAPEFPVEGTTSFGKEN